MSVEAGLGEQDLGGGDIEKLNGRASYSNDRFGFVVYGSENRREQVTDNREMEYVGTQGALVPADFSFGNYHVERDDQAYKASVQAGSWRKQVRGGWPVRQKTDPGSSPVACPFS